MIANSSPLPWITITLVALAIIFGSGAAVAWHVYDKVPEWRKWPKAARLYRTDRERVKDWKLRRKYPQAFVDPAFAPPHKEGTDHDLLG